MKENQDGLEVKLWTGVFEKETIWEVVDDEFSFISVD